MLNTIKKELAQHIINRINDRVIDNTNRDEWHFHCFNEDYYIIGYYNASQWLKEHDMDAFEAIDEVIEFEKDHFGEVNTDINSESIVNMLAYIYGSELIYEEDYETVEELQQAMQKIVQEL